MSSNANEELEHLYRRLHALVLGGSDLYDVLQTAQYLRGEHPDAPGHDGRLPWHVRRTLETGMFVTYARPFVDASGRGLPQLKRARGLSAELRASHEEILERRNRVYAHTDETPLRRILELSNAAERAAWVREQRELSEEWFPPTREGLEDVVALATAHLESFLSEIDEVSNRILATEGAETDRSSSAR
jgi:hypothetical protein